MVSMMDWDVYVSSFDAHMDYAKQEMSVIGNLMKQWKNIGFIQLKADPCCYLRHQGEEFDILLIWVDDMT